MVLANELRTGLAELGMAVNESEIYALMETIDMDGNGDVDRDEFGVSSRLVFNTSTAIARPMYCCTYFVLKCDNAEHCRSLDGPQGVQNG